MTIERISYGTNEIGRAQSRGQGMWELLDHPQVAHLNINDLVRVGPPKGERKLPEVTEVISHKWPSKALIHVKDRNRALEVVNMFKGASFPARLYDEGYVMVALDEETDPAAIIQGLRLDVSIEQWIDLEGTPADTWERKDVDGEPVQDVVEDAEEEEEEEEADDDDGSEDEAEDDSPEWVEGDDVEGEEEEDDDDEEEEEDDSDDADEEEEAEEEGEEEEDDSEDEGEEEESDEDEEEEDKDEPAEDEATIADADGDDDGEDEDEEDDEEE